MSNSNIWKKEFVINKKIVFCIQLVVVFLLSIFAILSLWFITVWKIPLKDQNMSIINIMNETINTDNGNTTWLEFLKNNSELNVLYNTYQNALNSDFSLYNINSNIKNIGVIIDTLLAISFIGLFSIIPTLSLKKGTLFSFISISLSFILFVIVISLFIVLFVNQYEIGSAHKKLVLEWNKIKSNSVDNVISSEKLIELSNGTFKSFLEKLAIVK